MRIATFNVQNLRLRHVAGHARLDGARDGDVPEDNSPQAMALDLADRRLTAAVLARADAPHRPPGTKPATRPLRLNLAS